MTIEEERVRQLLTADLNSQSCGTGLDRPDYKKQHNKQYYDENGKPKFVTDKGNTNPDDYSITFRTKRTAGRTGGGCQLSFTGDGKTPNTSLNKDGSVTDSQTGIEREV